MALKGRWSWCLCPGIVLEGETAWFTWTAVQVNHDGNRARPEALMARHTFGKLRVATATPTLPRCTTPNIAERNRTPHLSLDCHAPPSNPSNKKNM